MHEAAMTNSYARGRDDARHCGKARDEHVTKHAGSATACKAQRNNEAQRRTKRNDERSAMTHDTRNRDDAQRRTRPQWRPTTHSDARARNGAQ